MSLDGLFRYPLKEIPFVLLVLMIAFTVHEFAHAYTASKFGDPTPGQMGRVTLNPRVHLDILGTLLFLIVGIGWAKPVLVNRSYFKRPRLMGIIVSFVGPLSNLILGFMGLFLVYSLIKLGWLDSLSTGMKEAISIFLKLLITMNLFLFILNLIPLPPLDGYRILQDLLPYELRIKLQKVEQWAMLLILLMVFIPPVSQVTLDPIFALQWDIFDFFNSICIRLFGFRVF